MLSLQDSVWAALFQPEWLLQAQAEAAQSFALSLQAPAYQLCDCLAVHANRTIIWTVRLIGTHSTCTLVASNKQEVQSTSAQLLRISGL